MISSYHRTSLCPTVLIASCQWQGSTRHHSKFPGLCHACGTLEDGGNQWFITVWYITTRVRAKLVYHITLRRKAQSLRGPLRTLETNISHWSIYQVNYKAPALCETPQLWVESLNELQSKKLYHWANASNSAWIINGVRILNEACGKHSWESTNPSY